MSKQWYVVELNGFEEDESQELFNQAFGNVDWKTGQSMAISHLTDKGVADLKKHVFKQEETQ